MRIRITCRPDGEAPEWVRDAWIGAVLPVINEQARNFWGFGVLTGPKGLFGMIWKSLTRQGIRYRGFCVRSVEAVAILEDKNPDAARWWRDNCPSLLNPKGAFLLQMSECEIVHQADETSSFSNPWKQP